MVEFDSDVVVVGGGPAGVIVSYAVAKAGFKVILLDKKKVESIGDKTCGDALDFATAELLSRRLGIDLPEGDEVSDEIKTMSIAAGGIDTKIRLTAPGYVTDRLNYGQRLLKMAKESGVEIRAQSPVRELIIDDQYVSGVRYIDRVSGEKRSIRSKFVVDASGAYATVRRLLPDNIRGEYISKDLPDDMVWPTYREIVKLDKPHRWMSEIVLWYPHDLPIPGYVWVFSKGEGSLNLGIGWLKSEKNMPSLKKEYRRYMEQLGLTDFEVIKSGGGQIPIRIPFDSNVFNGGVIVGDAACMVHPTTAEGHGPALESALYAAEAIVDALKKDRRDRAALWGYNLRIMDHIGPKHANAYLMRVFLENIGSKGLERLITRKFISDEEMDRIVRGEELKISGLDKIKKALRLFPHIGLIGEVVKFQKGIAAVNELYGRYPKDEKELSAWVQERNSLLGYDF